MNVEETCCCGGKLVLQTADASSRALQEMERREVWQQVEKWRRLHKACLVARGKQP